GLAPETPAPQRPDAVVPWVLSGRTEQALAHQAARLLAWLRADDTSTAVDVGWSLATTRSAFEHRAVLVGADRAALTAELAGLASPEPGGGVVVGRTSTVGQMVFVFPGQGSQWLG